MGHLEVAVKPLPDDVLLRTYEAEICPSEIVSYTFEEIFERHQDHVFRLAFRLLGNYDDALELTQEVFLVVHQKLDTFKGNSSLHTWLYRITVNRACNLMRWWRVRKRSTTLSFQILEPSALMRLNLSQSQGIKTPEQSILGNEMGERINRGIQQLSLKYRAALVMKDMEDMSYEEIADALEISIGTVKSRIARAREQLRLWLESGK